MFRGRRGAKSRICRSRHRRRACLLEFRVVKRTIIVIRPTESASRSGSGRRERRMLQRRLEIGRRTAPERRTSAVSLLMDEDPRNRPERRARRDRRRVPDRRIGIREFAKLQE
jgi:hypothetical protein